MAGLDNVQKTFDPMTTEKELYANWEKQGYFKAAIDPKKKPFCIMMPPPNITGQLHMGHALDNTLQDILTRFKRMQGFCALWLPGTDHASIATEARIVAAMKEEGLTKDGVGREGFLTRAWAWKDKYGTRIVDQLQRLGSSCDWERERFTMDEGLSRAVTEVFIRYYEKGLIYRGERIINWCPHCMTSISDAEVEYDERDGFFWHIRYPVADDKAYLVLATTRPETLLGDTAVAVHPNDERYKHLVGKDVILPLLNRRIPIIADTYVDKSFGTGVVKITPAHDPNDFEVGMRHQLPAINIMHDDAVLNEHAGPYEGMERYAARKKIVEDLRARDLLEKIEPHQHSVGTCYRCQTTVEPRLSLQWFVKMASLARPAIDAIKQKKARFIPMRFEKIYFNWMENIRDWCISRQLWWGHRIPAYYCDACQKMHVVAVAPDHCPACGSDRIHQDEDSLDTWFSSALWPFSTLGWPDKTEELDYFYPTSVLITGYDIITFWVARMMFSGLTFMGDVPFCDILIHGIIRDADGRKMSKSLGNGVDPLDLIDKYGADALRYTLVTGNAPGNDQRFREDRIEAGRHFSNKIWNAMRFVLMHLPETMPKPDMAKLTLEDRWILSLLNRVISDVTQNLEKYEFGIALSKIYAFIWEAYCDWYIEMAKPRLFDKNEATRAEVIFVLRHVLKQAMQLLHPFMPFLTEEVFLHLRGKRDVASIMIASWPQANKAYDFPDEEKQMTRLMDAIRAIRNIRTEMKVDHQRHPNVILVTQDQKMADLMVQNLVYLQRLANVGELRVQATRDQIPDTAVAAILEDGELFIPLGDLIDIDMEKNRLNAELEKLDEELVRVKHKLSNQAFVAKAPKNVVDAERQKEEKYATIREGIEKRLNKLSGERGS